MKTTNEFLCPDYYGAFACKMGACRHACCVGWPISISVDNYFRLLGCDCSKALRDRLDVGMHLADNPSPERYAQFNIRYDGDCALRMPDGRCSIHAEIGEDILPDICRLYPRAIHADREPECVCANSCEAVVELLFRHPAPLVFRMETRTVDVPDGNTQTGRFDTLGRGQALRLYLIRMMQERSMPLPARLLALREAVVRIEEALDARDGDALDALLAEPMAPAPTPQVEDASVEAGLAVMRDILTLLDARHDSIRDYGEASLPFCDDAAAYRRAAADFEARFPEHTVWIENLLVNHLFFVRFPFQDRPVSPSDEWLAVVVAYALVRFLGITHTATDQTEEALVDVLAAAFRLIEHTSFEVYAAAMLRKLGNANADAVRGLLVL